MRVPSIFALLPVTAIAVVAANDSGTVRVFLDPREIFPVAGQSRLVRVQVEGVPADGLAAFQVTLRFDPRRLEVRDPNTGFGVPAFAPLGGSPLCPVVRQQPDCPDPQWLLSATGRSPMGTFTVDPERGLVTIAYGTSGDAAPVAGRGTLAVIEVIGQGRGRGGLEIVDALLVDAAEPPGRYPVASRPDRRAFARRGFRHDSRD